MLPNEDFSSLEEKIGYEFQDKKLLLQALTHSSFSNEQKINKHPNYERLEFLGDAVLELISSQFFFEHYPEWKEGQLTRVRSSMVCEPALAYCARDISLQKYDSYATAKNALENGNGAAWANDNTEVIAFAKQNSGYTVGIPSLGSQDTIAPAVSKGNTTLLDWINDEIKSLGEESFFHKDYEETLVDTYGLDYEDELVVEGGETNA